ncbi:hypothetical protein HDV03_000571 [Kappamyces sp. JEL0829]|nr:hypothetical protein HDV03_000571 [Kappamyces sp. JEL0829]
MGHLVPTCYGLCILKPGTRLSAAETTCVERCKEQFSASVQITAQVFAARMNEMLKVAAERQS